MQQKHLLSPLFLFLLLILLHLSPSFSLYVRKNQKNMSREEIDRFVTAVRELKRRGIYDEFVRLHGLTFPSGRTSTGNFLFNCVDQIGLLTPTDNPDCWNWAHQLSVFLPWHRQYLLLFERALQTVDEEVYIPYWNWLEDNSTDPSINQLFSNYFMGGDGDSSNHMIVTRGPFSYWPNAYTSSGPYLTRNIRTYGRWPSMREAEEMMAIDVFDQYPYRGNVRDSPVSFRKALEGYPPMDGWAMNPLGYMHNNIHNLIGGSMRTDYSPNDPLFFIHHCFLDFLWSKWMLLHPFSEPYLPISDGPTGTNFNDMMAPWDGVYNTPAYRYYYQYDAAAPLGMNVYIRDVCVPDEMLGYQYEELSLFLSYGNNN